MMADRPRTLTSFVVGARFSEAASEHLVGDTRLEEVEGVDDIEIPASIEFPDVREQRGDVGLRRLLDAALDAATDRIERNLASPRACQRAEASGFVERDGALFQVVVTPVYVAAAAGSALLDVLVAGIEINSGMAQELKRATGGSEFVFQAHGRTAASTLPANLESAAKSSNAALVVCVATSKAGPLSAQ